MIPLGGFHYPAAYEASKDQPACRKKAHRSNGTQANSAEPRPARPATAASSLNSGTQRRRNPFNRPLFLRRSPPKVTGEARKSLDRRPRHVPIVIPDYKPQDLIVATPTSFSSGTTYTTTAKGAPQISNFLSNGSTFSLLNHFPIPNSRKDSPDSIGRLKPRHVEIVIPDWVRSAPIFGDPNITFIPRSPTPPRTPGSLFESTLDSDEGTMARSRTPATSSRSNTIDSTTSRPSPSQLQHQFYSSAHIRNGTTTSSSGSTTANTSATNANMHSNINGSSTSLHRLNTNESTADRDPVSALSRTPGSAIPSAGPSPAIMQTAGLGTPSSSQSTAGLSGLVCNVHRTTGREPPPLVGATTTVLGDKLYVFGGRRLSRSRPHLTADIYELDLIRRHWTKLECKGDIPPPRYFHSMCALGDTKLVCYGGMSPSRPQSGHDGRPATASAGQESSEVVVMSDIHIFDVRTATWMQIQTTDSPQGRYAHCAAILPSSAVFTSSVATLSAVLHNPASTNPNQGQLGVSLDGTGGAEMVVVGGQDSANHYIEQISVFNLRSLKWTATNSLGRSCGAYRSVVAPLNTMNPSDIGAAARANGERAESEVSDRRPDGQSSMLIYSNYNFLDVKLELQVRHPDGTLSEKPMHGTYSPPGLRFPNGGVINNHFVVSGTFLTSSKQEYALWALDLNTLTWSRIDAGGNVFSQGSWNRGVLWNRRNTFVILGNRRRSLVEDYNHRRINFSNVCMVELEAFGLYDNPRRVSPRSQYASVSSPANTDRLDQHAGGRKISPAAEDLGSLAMGVRELADMDFLAITGERIPVNSRIVARRWGPYFNQLIREISSNTSSDNADTATLRPGTSASHPSRNSSITITPSIKTTYSSATTLTNNTSNSADPSNPHLSAGTSAAGSTLSSSTAPFDPPTPHSAPPASRPRTLYLPHTVLTLQSLTHYLYTSSLPPANSPLCTPQILCSLLQIARPYLVDGLLEAIIERQHALLDGRNTAAIFNAAAMAAGGGEGVSFYREGAAGGAISARGVSAAQTAAHLAAMRLPGEGRDGPGSGSAGSGSTVAADGSPSLNAGSSAAGGAASGGSGSGNAEIAPSSSMRNLRINTDLSTSNLQNASRRAGAGGSSDDELSSASTSASASDLGSSSAASASGRGGALGTEREVWSGELSAVVGLQKRGLRGLMEGRRIREMGRAGMGGPVGGAAGAGGAGGGEDGGRVGLGIA